MKILILGAGAVGLSLAAKLSRVSDVVAVTRSRYLQVLINEGISISGAWGTETVHFPCTSGVVPRDDFDYIVLTTKSYDTESVCCEYADFIKDHETVSLQNGIGNEETISRFTDRVIGGVVMTGFVREGPGQVRITANAGPMQLGRFPSGSDASVEEFAGLLQTAGIAAEVTGEIKVHLWSKALINAVLNPLSAILGVTYGELTSPEVWQIIEEIVHEFYTAARAEGIRLQWPEPDIFLGYLHGVLIPVMATHTSSMLQDILSGKRSEIQYLNGAVVQTGIRHGIPVPYNTCITNLIRTKERIHRI